MGTYPYEAGSARAIDDKRNTCEGRKGQRADYEHR